MQLLFVLLFVLSIAAFAGWVWLVAAGFRRSALWGVCLLLLSPISAIVYAVKYWDEARKPFLLYAGSSVVGILAALVVVPLAIGQAAAEMSTEMTNAIERRPVDTDVVRLADATPPAPAASVEQAADEADDPGPSAAETLAAVMLEQATPAAHGPDSGLYLSEPAPSGFRGIRVGDASRFLGDYVRFVDADGGEHDGRLKSVDGNTIVFERHLTAGTFVFEYRRNEIRNLYVAY